MAIRKVYRTTALRGSGSHNFGTDTVELEEHMSNFDELKRLIKEGRLTFQNPKFQDMLLSNSASADLQALVVHLCSLEPMIQISSVVRPERGHPEGQAVDISNEEIAHTLLPRIVTDAEVKRLRIDQIIFDARLVSSPNH